MAIESVERLLHRASRLKYEAVYFDDDTFTRDRSHAIAVARLCKKYGLVFGCHTRPDCEDREVITELVSNGCRYMFSGLESVVPEILLGANKTHDPKGYREAYRQSFRIKNNLGLQVSAFLIHGMARRVANARESLDDAEAGLTWEPDTIDDSIASLEFALRELDPTYLSMNILRFIPATPFAEGSVLNFCAPLRDRSTVATSIGLGFEQPVPTIHEVFIRSCAPSKVQARRSRST